MLSFCVNNISGKIIHSETRNLIMKVLTFFENEKVNKRFVIPSLLCHPTIATEILSEYICNLISGGWQIKEFLNQNEKSKQQLQSATVSLLQIRLFILAFKTVFFRLQGNLLTHFVLFLAGCLSSSLEQDNFPWSRKNQFWERKWKDESDIMSGVEEINYSDDDCIQ